MKFEKIKIKDIHDIEIGDIVFNFSKDTHFIVTEKGKTILHAHIYVIIIDVDGVKYKCLSDSFKQDEEILRISYVNSEKSEVNNG